ncbi:pseudouridine synthase [Rubritalea spongiae]|uniref:Pseudouridine synthase n=1 Tax=Rubritalea spongiae TaxID=430797 RepID=A0ABW5E0R5_9BACT
MVILLNKPYGVLSQFNKNPDFPNQRVLGELNLPPELHPVGRLDMDSEGMLLLTDDKQLETDLLNPDKGHKRTYLVQVDGVPSEEAVHRLRSGGLEIKGHVTKKCRVELLSEHPRLVERIPAVDVAAAKRSSWLRMELSEGRNRQVRRMTAKVGNPTLRLVREKIGVLKMEGLELGEWRVLSEQEVEKLWMK